MLCCISGTMTASRFYSAGKIESSLAATWNKLAASVLRIANMLCSEHCWQKRFANFGCGTAKWDKRSKQSSMISVIIPTFNEARYLPATFDAIQRNEPAHEVIVVDADSFDGTIDIAFEHGARVVWSSARQRA